MLIKRPKIFHFKYLILLFIFIGIGKFSSGQNVDLLPDTIRSCQVDSVQIVVEEGYTTYNWSNGSYSNISWFNASGEYSIEVTLVDTISTTTIQDTFNLIIMDAKVAVPDSTIACGDSLKLYGSNPAYLYFWEPDNQQVDTLITWPRDTTNYYVTISDPDDFSNYCFDSVTVTIEPVIMIDTMIQLGMGCPGEEKGKVKFEVSGGYPPYYYEWPLGADVIHEDSSQATGLIDGEKSITISDTLGCYINHEFEVKAFPLPELELFSDPADTVYFQNPYVDFSFENPTYDSLVVDTFMLSWTQWKFGDDDSTTFVSPTHIYQKTGSFDVVLEFRTFYDCFGSDTLKLEVEPVKLKFPVAITPNGDEANDIFEIWDENQPDLPDPIDLKKYYLSNTLTIFNRWGEKVFETDNYENDWGGEELVDGTYFYVLKCQGEHRDDVFKGSILILRDKSF